jgi:DNA-binding MarR family transcriptional regulator
VQFTCRVWLAYRWPVARRSEVARTASELRIVLGQLVRRLRAEHRFPISQATVLSRLDRDGPMTTSALAVAERLRPQSMAQTIGDMEADGLVTRTPDPADRRRVLIDLSDGGRAALAEDRARREGWLAQTIETELTSEEQDLLIRAVALLRRLAQN